MLEENSPFITHPNERLTTVNSKYGDMTISEFNLHICGHIRKELFPDTSVITTFINENTIGFAFRLLTHVLDLDHLKTDGWSKLLEDIEIDANFDLFTVYPSFTAHLSDPTT